MEKLGEQLEDWSVQIKELQLFFESRELPKILKLAKNETILDVRSFVASHMSIVERNNGNKIFKPYLTRLIKIQTIIKG